MHEFDAALIGNALRHVERAGLRHVTERHHGEETGISSPHQAEEAAQIGIEDVDHAEIAPAQCGAAIGVKINRDTICQVAWPASADIEPLTDRAAVAVGSDHIFGANNFRLSGLYVADLTGDAASVLFERHQLGGVAKLCAQFLGAGANERLEALLGHEQPCRWADRGDAFIEVGDVGRDFLAGKRFNRIDAAVGIELLLGGRADASFETDGTQHLECAEMKVPGAWVNSGAVMTLDRERRHTMPGEACRCRKPNQTAADDEDVGFDHVVFPRTGVSSWPRRQSRGSGWRPCVALVAIYYNLRNLALKCPD